MTVNELLSKIQEFKSKEGDEYVGRAFAIVVSVESGIDANIKRVDFYDGEFIIYLS